MDVANGDPYTLSELSLSAHAGTHVDAPRHLFPAGKTLDALPLETFVGEARVVELRGPAVTAEALEAARIPLDTSRLLLKTRADNQSPSSYLTEDAARWIARRGARLVGIDSISVDPEGSEDLPAHRILLGADIAIIEGLDLSAVNPGPYILACLPLKLRDADGAPARVVLIEDFTLLG